MIIEMKPQRVTQITNPDCGCSDPSEPEVYKMINIRVEAQWNNLPSATCNCALELSPVQESLNVQDHQPLKLSELI